MKARIARGMVTTRPASSGTENAYGWPFEFERIPNDEWASRTIHESALKYDEHRSTAIGQSLEPTVAQILTVLDETKIFVDYSCGTGLLTERILANYSSNTRILNADVSKKYLNIALNKFRNDQRVAVRLLKRLHVESGFQSIRDVLDDALIKRGVDILTSTNAIHLYPDVAAIAESWNRILRPGGLALINTGDMSNTARKVADWRLHDTVENVNQLARDAIKDESRFEKYRDSVADADLMRSYAQLRNSFYPPVRPVDFYLDSLSSAGLSALHAFELSIPISRSDLAATLIPYHDVVLGWVGGSTKVEGEAPSHACLRDRLFLIRYCVQKLYGEREFFLAPWTYITCKKG
ncbi:class I SAM-dependent methyltransferase [Amycolatopsis alkalitolerans]|uniref:Class I SAM-dependent methyltransferase n=1 Tax=Amycolatopsis alkalitolerans TaxID=2547244 RepID=A0A5C4LQG2_9PSEU|nr:class I SAM-dependent methyltransferase [Amycolatopsis alkalitolerans]TNC19270.1 class I SAM-dependent methyltransferase [Amycolatopsis alkalitolerans]